MNEKSKKRHAMREAKQEEQGKKVMTWLVGVLAFMALLLLIYAMQFT